MSTICLPTHPDSHAMFRIGLRRDLPIRVPQRDGRRRKHHRGLALLLVGHFATTTFVLVSLMILTSIVSWTHSYIQSIHPLPERASHVLLELEIALIYLDVFAAGLVLSYGLMQFIFNAIRGDS